MFSKADKTKKTYNSVFGGKPLPESPLIDNRDAHPSIIAPDMHVTGNLVTSGRLHIDGKIDGDISCNDIVVGDGAIIRGNIRGGKVRVCGTVMGEITADNVELAKTAKVKGDIVHKAISVEQGASIEGMLRHFDQPMPMIGEYARQIIAEGPQYPLNGAKITEPEKPAALKLFLKPKSKETEPPANTSATK